MSKSSAFKVDWANADEPSARYTINSGTYPAYAFEVDTTLQTKGGKNPGSPMVRVNFEFPQVRVTQRKRGRAAGSNEVEVVTQSNRRYPKYFTFGDPFSRGLAKEYLKAAGVASAEELDGEMEIDTVLGLFDKSQGAELGVRMVQKNPKEGDRSEPDEFGKVNDIGGFFHKDSPRFQRAKAAIGTTINKDDITF